MLFVLDASAVLNEPNFSFDSRHSYITTPDVMREFRALESRALAENALHHSLLEVRSPSAASLKKAREKIEEHNFDRVSNADVSVIALALELKREDRRFIVLTDDFSIQNFLSLFEIPFSSVLQGEIEERISFERYCPGCGKLFGKGFSGKKCPECGSRIQKRRKTIN